MKIELTLPEEGELDYTEHDIEMIIAINLYEKEVLSLEQCAKMIGMGKKEFKEEMEEYGAEVYFEVGEEEEETEDDEDDDDEEDE